MPDPGGVRTFAVPDLGEGLEDATVVEWLVEVGDVVELNQPVCTVETAKAEVELPSPFAGEVVERVGAPGETLPVGSVLLRIDTGAGTGAGVSSPPPAPGRSAGSSAPGAGAGASGSRRPARSPVPGGAASPSAAGAGAPVGRDDPPAPPSDPGPAAAPAARQAVLVGYGADTHEYRRRRALPASAPSTPAARSGRALAKPPVRWLARSLGVDLATLAPGSGPGGIVTRADVQAAAVAPGAPARSSVTAPVPAPAPALAEGYQVVPVRGVRARIAERMATSRSHIPDATCAVEVDFTRLLEVRRRLAAAAEAAGHGRVVTPFALVCRLVAGALPRHRALNASFVEDGPELHLFDAVHLGVGTATDRGLLVPVIRDAGSKTTLELATALADLSARARSGPGGGGGLSPAELSGSTFTISNFGSLGLDDGIPVINHPEVAILGVGTVKPRPFVVDGELAVRSTGRLTLAFDHRACDGAEAGAFLSQLRELIEQPELALLYA